MELHEIIQQRIDKLKSLRDKGIAIYASFKAVHMPIGQAVAGFEDGKSVGICGRITAKRAHGKVTFADLRDATGKLQLYLKADSLGAEKARVLGDLDIADFLYAKGTLFKTHTGELTVKVEDFLVLSKALRPLPEKWHGLKDLEVRYRQRYLDLVSNEEVRKVFQMRSAIIASLRHCLQERGYLEVETPMMHAIPGGAAGRPFKTHHNEYHLDLYMRIAPELYLKQLIVGGLDKVYEINRSFRNEGVSTRHNPEFTMLEAYCAYANYEDMMDLAEELVVAAAQTVLGKTCVTFQGKEIDFTRPWARCSFADMVKSRFDIAPSDAPEEMLRKLQANGFAREAVRLSRTQVTKIIEDILQEELSLRPTFVTDYFASMSPLAKTKKDNPLIAERFELYVAGMEIGNAYSEQNDPQEQKKRFEEELIDLEGDEKKSVDQEYILALEHGMPPAGGLGVGIDRLVMLLCDQPSIRDVIFFPLLRPQSVADED